VSAEPDRAQVWAAVVGAERERGWDDSDWWCWLPRGASLPWLAERDPEMFARSQLASIAGLAGFVGRLTRFDADERGDLLGMLSHAAQLERASGDLRRWLVDRLARLDDGVRP
jgi:hypothetical protein